MLTVAENFLIESIRKGDRKSYEFLFRNYYSNLCKYARNIVHNDATAEDLVMDVFVRIWEDISSITISSSISGYLYQSVHNHCLNYLTRKHKQFSELNSETIGKLNALMPPDLAADPFDGLKMKELRNRLDKSIEDLPEACREIFKLSRTEELSHKEIANQLGISENTVKVQIYRALAKIRVYLREYLPVFFLF
jgi:RNA polymerase sigma-70 factor, ECF subfamily